MAGLLCLVNAYAVLALLPDSSRFKQSSPHKVGYRTSSFTLIGKYVLQPGIGPLMLGYATTIFGFAFMEATLTWLVIDHFKLTNWGVYMVFAYIGVVVAMGQGGLVRRLQPKFGDQKLALIGTTLLAVSLLLLPLNDGLLYLLLVVGMLCIGESLCQPTLMGAISTQAKDSLQGETLGVAQSLASLARFIGPFLASALYAVGDYVPYFTASGIMLPALFFIAMGFAQSQKKTKPKREKTVAAT
jgi:MFS transporter, DHA1 family, tetracycline resistance protein